jgi:hypothetical protein
VCEAERARRFAAVLVGLVFAGAAYLACTHASVPLFWYHVTERAWSFGGKPATMAMGWYGRTLWVALAAVAGGLLGAALSAARHEGIAALGLSALAIVALAAVGATTADIVAENIHRPGTPLPPTVSPFACEAAADARPWIPRPLEGKRP